MNEKETVFLIPGRVTTRTELFPGIGWIELALICVAICAGLLLFAILGIPQKEVQNTPQTNILGQVVTDNTTNSTDVEKKTAPLIPIPLRLVIVILFGGSAFLLVRKENGVSMLDTLQRLTQFNQSKKRYFYRSRGI